MLHTKVHQSWEKGRLSFGTLEDVQAFVKLHMTKGVAAPDGGGGSDGLGWGPDRDDGSRAIYTGCFYDIVSALERIQVVVESGSWAPLKLLGDLRQAGFNDGIDPAMIQLSFTVTWPALLHKGGSHWNEKPLNRLKTMADWEDRGTRQGAVLEVNHYLEDGLRMATSLAEYKFQNQPLVRELVSLLNNGVREFWMELRNFVASFFQELTQGSKASEQEAWDLIRDMMSSVFKQIQEARSVAQSVASTFPMHTVAERVEQAALIIWGTVQAHRVMEELMQAKFKGHPCVVLPSLMLLLNHRVPTQMVTDLQAKVDAGEKERNEMKSKIHKMNSMIERLEKKCERTMTATTEIQRQNEND